MGEIDPRVQLAIMLIGLGVTTYQKVAEFFKKDINDEQVLADLLVQLDSRIARRDAE